MYCIMILFTEMILRDIYFIGVSLFVLSNLAYLLLFISHLSNVNEHSADAALLGLNCLQTVSSEMQSVKKPNNRLLSKVRLFVFLVD